MEQVTSRAGFGIDLHSGNLSSYHLILAAQRGDATAFEELVHTYDAMVMRVALTLTASEAEAQEIYCQVFRDAFASVGKLDSGSSVFIWLYRILVRHCLEYCRRNRGSEPNQATHDSPAKLARALVALPPTERIVLQLKQFQGLKIRTLAEIFDAPPEFIIKTLQAAINRLRAQLNTDLS